METELIEISSVVLANTHNATILNPDFLERNQIVRKEWEWSHIGEPLTTPAISTVHYDSEVAVTVEPMKLQVSDKRSKDIAETNVFNIISQYVSVLHHVEYTALGINFTKTAKVDGDVTEFLIDRFIKPGLWNSATSRIVNTGIRFNYELENGVIAISIAKGIREKDKETFIVTQGNFHRDLDTDKKNTSEQVKEYLNKVNVDWLKFLELHSTIIES